MEFKIEMGTFQWLEIDEDFGVWVGEGGEVRVVGPKWNSDDRATKNWVIAPDWY